MDEGTKDEPPGAAPPGTVLARGPELAVAGLLMAVALLVIADSLRVGIAWADDGPRAGYFPFYIGLLLLATSGYVFLSKLLAFKRETAVFAERSQLALVVAVLIPIAVYTAVIYATGIYVASALLIAYFMKRYGKYGWGLTALVALGVPLVFFMIFERWFLVPLPKGPLEAALGF